MTYTWIFLVNVVNMLFLGNLISLFELLYRESLILFLVVKNLENWVVVTRKEYRSSKAMRS